MRIYTKAGDLAFRTFTFPDGQPHFKLETHDVDFRDATIETAIRNPTELFEVLLANDVLRQSGYTTVNLEIRYLMGARMDRSISPSEPFSLAVVAKLLNGCGFTRVRILDAHSEVATRLIRNSVNVLPFEVVNQVRTTLKNPVIVCPDKGAVDRVYRLVTQSFAALSSIVYCKKVRDPQTGKLSEFSVDIPHPADKFSPFDALILDDICDGGGTFVGLAKELRKAGAKKVYLYVTHGIFSKGLPLEGIDHVFTTDSFCDELDVKNSAYRPFETSYHIHNAVTVVPISMKELM